METKTSQRVGATPPAGSSVWRLSRRDVVCLAVAAVFLAGALVGGRLLQWAHPVLAYTARGYADRVRKSRGPGRDLWNRALCRIDFGPDELAAYEAFMKERVLPKAWSGLGRNVEDLGRLHCRILPNPTPRFGGPLRSVIYWDGPNGIDERGAGDDSLTSSTAPPRAPQLGVIYSAGPNGIDEQGLGDDEFGRRGPYPVRGFGLPLVLLVVWPWHREVLVGLAVFALWCARPPFRRTPRSPDLLVEGCRAAVRASLPAAVLVGSAICVMRSSILGDAFLPTIFDVAHLPPTVVAAGGAALVVFCVAFSQRLRAPRDCS